MNIVTFETPAIEEEQPKPIARANLSYPYNQIASPRRFEELLYSICKARIEAGAFGDYDNASLMSGVGDQGRDCALFKRGKSHGVIQCKKYDRNYGKEDFGLEIVKFVLYSLLDNRLIYDRSDFTYHIALSTGLTAECSQFIDDFSNNVLSEPHLSHWITKNLQAPTLSPLKLSRNDFEIATILSQLKVVKIRPQDIDADLTKPSCSSLIPLFFEVRQVTDNSKIDQLIQTLEEKKLTEEGIKRQLRIGSASLQSERNSFEGIDDSHIPRKETEELLNWILADLEKDKQGKPLNICLLAGQAGYGKTVILKDLYTECSAQNIPVLGLKADKLYSYTIVDLQKSAGLSFPIYDFIEEGKKYFVKTVILIDQIDALSQSMSSDRSYLNVFRNFITYFANDENVRIIISVRIHDLHYDPSLRVYKDMKTFEVKPLDENDVIKQLEKLGIRKENLSSKLMQLLRIPNHLNIFSRVAASNDKSLRARSIQDLYFELWNQKVLETPSTIQIVKLNIKQALYNITDRMFNSQRITISQYQFENFTDELRYLESERLIKREGTQLQFFHQSFYDFVFAKQFVEDGKDLMQYIKEAEQSIHIRSAVKMIISYLRDFDPRLYLKVLERIFHDEEILFHIKHIMLSIVLSQEEPTKHEVGFALNTFATSIHFGLLFFEQANSKEWFNVAKENSLLDLLKQGKEDALLNANENIQHEYIGYRRNACINFLRKFIAGDNDGDAWGFLNSLDDLGIVKNLLFSVENWSNPLTWELWGKCEDFEETDSFGYYHVLNNLAKWNPDFALAQLAKVLPRHYKNTHSDRNYEEREVLKTLSKSNPHKLFPVLFDIMKVDFDEVEDDQILIRDWQYNYVDLDDKESLYGSEFLYRLLGVCLKRSAENYKNVFLSFFNDHKKSKYQAILRLLLFAVKGRKMHFAEQIFELFCYFNDRGLLSSRDDLEHDLREAFEEAFPYFNQKQKDSAAYVIKNYTDKEEIFYRKATATEKRIFSSIWGLGKYYWLLRLPDELINADVELKRSFQELERKFITYKDKPRKRTVIAGAVGSPIPATAYQYITNTQWLKSFRKYNSNRERNWNNFLKGGLEELTMSFQNAVKENPTEAKLKIIQAAIDDLSVDIKYAVYGLWGWTESKANTYQALPLFKKILSRNYQSEVRMCVTIAGRLIGNETEDIELVQFIIATALDFKKEAEEELEFEEKRETSINGLVAKGINTTYGSAARVLAYINDPKYEEIVFQAAKTILSQGPPEARAALISKFAYLLRLNRDRASNLFCESINQEENIYVIASSIESLQYMRSYGLEQIASPYEKLIQSKLLGKEDSHFLFLILYGSYLHNKCGASELLYMLLATNEYSCSGAIRDVLKYYYEVPDSRQKNDKLLHYVLDKATEEDFETLNWSFIHVEHVKLEDIYEFLKKYIESKYFTLSENFIKFLILQCNQSPFKAIELFELALKNNQPQIKQHSGIRANEAAVKFIVGAFDALSENDPASSAERKKLLNSFDVVLKDYRLRRDAERILEELV